MRVLISFEVIDKIALKLLVIGCNSNSYSDKLR